MGCVFGLRYGGLLAVDRVLDHFAGFLNVLADTLDGVAGGQCQREQTGKAHSERFHTERPFVSISDHNARKRRSVPEAEYQLSCAKDNSNLCDTSSPVTTG